MRSPATKRIDVVVPVHNEEANLQPFQEELARTLAAKLPHLDWRVTFVDDGSRDQSWSAIQSLVAHHDNVRALKLNRNYGSHIAISAGVHYADADAVVIIAADLQDPPAVIPEFVRAWEEGFRVVWGVRAERREAAYRALLSRAFHGLVHRYALPGYPLQGTGSFCLIDRTIVANLSRMRESFRTIFGLIALQGYRAAEVPYVREARRHGRSGWSLGKMIHTAIDVFTSYSHLPVRIVTWVGFTSCALAFLAIVYQVAHYYVFGRDLRGWTMLFAAICFFGGIQTLALGVLGEYIWRTFHEVKYRPLWFVEQATFDVDVGPR
ncbi:MAG TPA: glycosyltransferase family 2 protein [Methylomirabilota bacterium]|nr:glycosyltransferase family 2 protein [Methylomirabilota bacterium]